MKFSFAFLAVLFVARALEISAVPIHNEQHKTLASAGLSADLQDFLALVPVNKIQEIFYQYLSDDDDFGAALDYLLSDEFQSLIIDIEAEAEVRELLNYLEDAGLTAYDFINKINDILGIDRISPKATFRTITGGLPGFIKDIKAVLPIDMIEKLYKEKLETSPDFAELVKRLSSQEFQGLINKIMTNPELQNLMKRAEAKGVDVQAILDFFTSVLGLKFPSRPVFSLTRSLKDDLNEFLALIPVEKIKDIFFKYLTEDEDFAEAVDYLLSNEFKSLVVEIESQPEVLSILKYLQESGLNAYEFVNKINSILGIDNITPRRYTSAKRSLGGLNGFFKDVEAVLPLKEIEELYEEMMASSKEFYALMKKLSSPQFQKLVDQIMTSPKMQNLIRRAEAKGVNIQSVFDFLTNLLGLHFPSQRVYSLKKNLKDDLNDFLALVPVERIKEIFYDYLANDEAFGEALDYVLSEEFQGLIIEIEAQKEVKQLLQFLQESGLQAHEFINKINDILGIEHIVPRIHYNSIRITGGLPGFIQDIKATLPIDQIKKLYDDKLKSSSDFAALIKRLSSDEFQGLVDKLLDNAELQNLIKRAEAKGVDVQAIFEFFSSLLGLKFPSRPVFFLTRNLKDDLNDFLALVPVERIKEIFYDYLANDEAFGEALDYVLSEEFQGLIIEIEAQKEVKQLLQFLQESGLQAHEFINKINDILGIEHIVPRIHYNSIRITGGLPGFIQDIKATLPIDQIKKLYDDKLKSSSDFAALIKRLSSDEFQGLVDKLLDNAELQNLIKRAEAKGVDVQAIFEFFSSLLGLKFPSRPVFFLTRNLKDDLNDFLALVPVERIKEIFYDYLANDEAFGEALDYVLSEEFQGLIIEIEAQKEVKQLLQFLQESGLQAHEFINKINDILGIEHIVPRIHYNSIRITGGLPGFIQDIKATLPIDQIKKLYDDKLKSSSDFAALIKRLSSDEFQGLVDKLLDNAELQNLIKRAEAKGVDVQAIFEFFSSLLGLKFPSRPVFFLTRNLKDDLNDFLALVPVERIKEIFYDYLANDEAFGEALDYVLSEEFQGLIIEIEAQKEVKQLLQFLQESGLQAHEFINKINDILGIEHIVPRIHYNSIRITGGLPGFIQDIKATLSIDQIKKLYDDKLKSSSDFAALIKRLSSDEFQGLVDKLLDNAELQNLIKRAEAKGVDVQAIFEFFSSLLGLKFPSRPVFYKDEEAIDVLRQIWAKVPLDKILDIVVDYLIGDEDFKKVVKFMMGDEFKTILVEIEDLPDARSLLKFLHETGLDVYKWINDLHDLIGLDVELPSFNNYQDITGGVPGLIKDIRALLPLKELYKIYDEKRETSIKFREFINRLQHKELQNAVNALGKHDGFNLMLNKLEALGVDWDAVTEIISAIIGIKFPERPH
ncbi:uncharacterized protein LOC100115024 [Nasonia vitripennis]|uniref:Protein G12 n=1 Tax=Nasonia vitripennis TaxID=7425 RepID=A0A7M7LR36_NASVI|nr:uncharacterized protein LOC100115024 [Nasonia vitripennis]